MAAYFCVNCVFFLISISWLSSSVQHEAHGLKSTKKALKVKNNQPKSTTTALPAPADSAEVTRWLKTTHFNLRQCQPLQPKPFDPTGTGTFQQSSKTFVEVPMCQQPTPLPYDHYHFPNAFGQSKIEQVLESLYLWWPIVGSQCSEHLPSLLCSMYMPACFPLMPNKGEQPNILPCRETCESVRQSCDDVVVQQANLTWPWWLDCSLYPPKRLTPSDKSVAETIKYKDPVCIDFTDEQQIEHELLLNVDKVREDARKRAVCHCHCFANQVSNATSGEPYFAKKTNADDKQLWRDRLRDCEWGCNVWQYTFGVCYHELDAESVSVVVKLTRHSAIGWLLLTGFLLSLVLTVSMCSAGCCCEFSSRRRRGSNRRLSAGSTAAGETRRHSHSTSSFYRLFQWPLISINRPLALLKRRTFTHRNPYRHIASQENVIVVGDENVK